MAWLAQASQFLLSLSAIFTVPVPLLPSLVVELSPHFDDNFTPKSVAIRMTVPYFRVPAYSPIFLHYPNAGPNDYSADQLDARDVRGRIPLVVEDGDSETGPVRLWKPLRDTHGPVTVEYTAVVLTDLDEHAPCRSAGMLVAESGGFAAAGLSFLLQPSTDFYYNITYSWHLSDTPEGTRAICTFGEERTASTVAKAARLGDTVFAVGQINSYPAEEASKDFGLYWFDDPPFNTAKLGKDLEKLAQDMAAFFQDPSPLIRIFIRHNRNFCASGTAFYRSFVFGWTSLAVEQRSDGDFLEFLAHEMVHNWPVLQVPLQDQWYSEGIAEYYSIVLPYRFGIYTRQMFIERMNRMISGYYTNPDIDMPNAEAAAKFWSSDPHASRILYQRGFTYFVSLAAQLSHSPGGKPSLDDLISDMMQRFRSGNPTDISDFLALLSDALGSEALSDYHSMVNGKIIVPPAESLGQDYTLRRTDQERFYLGFKESSFSDPDPVVSGLDPKSRAAIEGGVLEGDSITSNHSFFWAAESWEKNFTMVVRRKFEGREDNDALESNVTLTWWPRTWEKVSSWQWVADF